MNSSDPCTSDNPKIWPTDLLGNEIRKNDMLCVNFPNTNLIMRVVDTKPLSLTEGMEIEGMLTLMVQVPHRGQCPIALVLKEPDEKRITPATQMPTKPIVKQ